MTKKVDLGLVDFVVNEFGMNSKITHGQFRRLVQVALIPKNGDKPSQVPKQLSDLSGEPASNFAQALTDLEKMGLLKRVDGTKGAYEINRNKSDWFPEEMSEAEKGIKKELDLLEQLRIETMEKLKAIKQGGRS